MPEGSTPGRALVTRRAVADIVRSVTLASYGVVGFSGAALDRLSAAIQLRQSGLSVSLQGGQIGVALRIRVANGVPIAEVARQVDAAIRYRIRQALGRDVDALTIRVAGLEARPVSAPPPPRRRRRGAGSSELADSGTDVA